MQASYPKTSNVLPVTVLTDVADPFRGPMKGYEKMATRITELTEKLVEQLFGRR